jgi:cell division protein FtsI/penicillin-binding protein 2
MRVYLCNLVLLGVVLAGLAGCFGGEDETVKARANANADAFARAWSSGADARAARLTTSPAAASRALTANRSGLDGATVSVRAGDVHADGSSATGSLAVTWQVPLLGRFAYRTPISLQKTGDAWHVRWSPRTIHPRLSATTRLGTVVDVRPRAPILDREGGRIVRQRAVVRIGLQRDKLTAANLATNARALARAVKINSRAYVRAVRGAGPKQFVEAVVLRRRDSKGLTGRLAGISGVARVAGEAPLTPSRPYARALLGAVGPATREQVTASRGRVRAGGEVGQWGLQQRFDAQLSGRASGRVVIRDASGEPIRTLLRRPRVDPMPLRTTLSDRAQRAAEHALADTGSEAAVVGVQPSTGDVLAVANRPVDSTYDRALAGSYPPGSTFKVITTAALLRAGLDPGSNVACPATLTVNGKVFRNFEGEQSGQATFTDDFAISCNTAFVSLAGRLAPDALQQTARDFGLGRTTELALTTAPSDVPPGRTAVERAAAMIGQERIVVSPLAMAGVAATVADGRWRAPRLLASDPRTTGPRLPRHELLTLRSLMRAVVVRGTGNVLASVPGGVAGKTGTAEYGGGDPPPTHAWFICFRGDIALAVLVEDGRSGAAVAAPIAKRFFDAYD